MHLHPDAGPQQSQLTRESILMAISMTQMVGAEGRGGINNGKNGEPGLLGVRGDSWLRAPSSSWRALVKNLNVAPKIIGVVVDSLTISVAYLCFGYQIAIEPDERLDHGVSQHFLVVGEAIIWNVVFVEFC